MEKISEGIEFERKIRAILTKSEFESFGVATVSKANKTEGTPKGVIMVVNMSNTISEKAMRQIIAVANLGCDVTYYGGSDSLEIIADLPLKEKV